VYQRRENRAFFKVQYSQLLALSHLHHVQICLTRSARVSTVYLWFRSSSESQDFFEAMSAFQRRASQVYSAQLGSSPCPWPGKISRQLYPRYACFAVAEPGKSAADFESDLPAWVFPTYAAARWACLQRGDQSCWARSSCCYCWCLHLTSLEVQGNFLFAQAQYQPLTLPSCHL